MELPSGDCVKLQPRAAGGAAGARRPDESSLRMQRERVELQSCLCCLFMRMFHENLSVAPSRDGVPPYRYRKQHRREMHESAKANGRVPLPPIPVSSLCFPTSPLTNAVALILLPGRRRRAGG